MNLNDAEIWVTTQSRIEAGDTDGCPFVLNDYGDAAEFDIARSDYFHTEINPVYKYPTWENIPDTLINRDWFCSNFFEVREALDQLDEPDQGFFFEWCRHHGHDISVDDPHLLVSHFTDMHGTNQEYEEPAESPAETSGYMEHAYSLSNLGISTVEFFDDNYD